MRYRLRSKRWPQKWFWLDFDALFAKQTNQPAHGKSRADIHGARPFICEFENGIAFETLQRSSSLRTFECTPGFRVPAASER